MTVTSPLKPVYLGDYSTGAVTDGIYRIDLGASGLTTIQSITIRDDNIISGGTGGASGFDLDFIKISTGLTSTASTAAGFAGIAGFDFSSDAVAFHPGFIQAWHSGSTPAWNTTTLFGTTSGNQYSPDLSTLGVLDAPASAPGGDLSLGEGGYVTFRLTGPISTAGLYLYFGDAGGGNDGSFVVLGDQPTQDSNGGVAIVGTSGGDNISLGTGLNVLLGDGADSVNGLGGNDSISTGTGNDTIGGGLGNDSLDGGDGADTAVFSGASSSYTITQTSSGGTVSGPDGTDSITNIETLKFDDVTLHFRIRPGVGVAVDFSAPPPTYMGPIRDFDGNDLGGVAGWKLIGTADVDGNGSQEHILVNSQIGRWASVGTAEDGLVYFDDHGSGGDTRVVGIYIDPLVEQGIVQRFSDLDSQRRFQNDLQINNIAKFLGQGDYDHDGLQEIYFGLADHTAFLHAYMHADGNIRYANYQNQTQMMDYLISHGFSSDTWSGWFT